MARKAELKSVLTLDNLKFVRTIRHSIKLAGDLARQFARAPIQSSFVAGLLSARKAVQSTGRGVEILASAARTSMKAIGVGAAVAAGAIGLVAKASIDAAAKLEQYETTFSVLLGSMDKAKERMADLVKFANETPFQLDEVTAASRELEVFTNGTLAAGKGLRLVGDVAAGTNTDFKETAINIGRLFDDLRSGRPAGRAMFSLQQMGALHGTSRAKIEGLGAANMGPEAWQVAQKELMRFSGMMDKQSKTWIGRMSTFKDSIQSALRSFGKPLLENFLPPLELAAKMIFGMSDKFAAAGKVFAGGLKEGVDFMVGAFSNPASIVAPLIGMLKAGFLEVGNVLIAVVRMGFSSLSSGSFWGKLLSGLYDSFSGLSKIIGAQLMQAFQGPVAFLISALEHAVPTFSFGPFGNPQLEFGKNARSIDQIKKDNVVSNLAADTLAEGHKQIKKGAQDLFEATGMALSKFAVEDVLGANKEFLKAKTLIRRVSAQGRAVMARNAQEPAAPGVMNNWDAWRSRVHTFGVANPLNREAVRTTPLLALQERHEFENKTVAGQMAAGLRHVRTSHLAHAFNAVRSGDRARMQEAQREKLREKSGLDQTNNILLAIQQRFDALVK